MPYQGIAVPIPSCRYSDYHILPILWDITMYIIISVHSIDLIITPIIRLTRYYYVYYYPVYDPPEDRSHYG
jgi:hypothetical protein